MPEPDNKLPFFLSEKELIQWTAHWHFHRRVLISGELNQDNLDKKALELAKLDFINSEPILLMIQSGGGKVTPTQQFEDVMRALNSPVDALVIGDCCSMAVDLVQMCRRRLILPAGRMLVHYIRSEQRWICDDMDLVEKDFRYFQEALSDIRDQRLELYRSRTGLSDEKLKEMFRHGETHRAYFSAKQAVALGLADEIVHGFKLFPPRS